MTKRQRVTAALRGQPVDRLPLAFWLHNFATENSASGLADETLRLYRAFDESERVSDEPLGLIVDESNVEDLLSPLELA